MNPVDKSMLFVLHPRDISIEISDVAPHAVTEAVYTSNDGINYLDTVLLKRWRERLFFRTRYERKMIFAITEPCLDSEEDLISFFHRHYEAGRYGRYFANQNLPCVLISPMEGVWAHDWICGPWFQMDFSGQDYRPDVHALLWDKEWEGGDSRAKTSSKFNDIKEWAETVPYRQELYWQIYNTIFKREFNPTELFDFPETWIQGSAAETRQLVQACVTVQPYTHHYIKRTGRKKNGRIYFQSEGAFKPLRCGLNLGLGHWSRLISIHNYFVGWNWLNTDTQTPHLRSSWQSRPIEIPLRIDYTNKTEDEIAEANNFLLGWIDDKVDSFWKGIMLRELNEHPE